MVNNSVALGNRVHMYARPDRKENLTEFFTKILGCEAALMPGTPILVIRFPNSSLSVEFTDDALDEHLAQRGTWLEVKPDDPVALKEKILAAGLTRIVHPGSDRFYFQSPGGQVWGIVE